MTIEEQSRKSMNMEEGSNEQEAIRNYLLGTLEDEAKILQIEEKLFANDEFAETLAMSEDALIEEYLDNELTDKERERFEKHFLILAERKESLQLVRQLRNYAVKNVSDVVEQSSEKRIRFFDWRSLFSSVTVRFAVAMLLVSAIGLGTWRVFFYQSDIDKGLAQLRLAYHGQRPTESRTTANFDYAPISDTRGISPIQDTKALIRAEGFLLNATENSSNAKSHQALGLLYLTNKKFDLALNEFNLSLNTAPNDASIYNDIGAALLEKSKQSENESKYDESLENKALSLKSLNRALELDGSLREALFNKALVLQKMSLTNQAQAAWEQYLEKDTSSPWADEARKNLEQLKQTESKSKDKSQVLKDFIDSFHNKDDDGAWKIISQTKEVVTGMMIQQQLIKKYLAENNESRKGKSSETLLALVYLGDLEKQNSGDPYFAELANYYAKTNKIQQALLLQAYQEFQTGNELILKPDFAQALEKFNHAQQLFSAAGNTWEAQLSEHRISYSLSRLDHIEESNLRLLKLSDFCQKKRYKWLQTLTDSWIGENYFFLGESSKAIIYNRKALDLAQLSSDNYNIHRILIQFTEIYKTIGESSKALLSTYQNLVLADTYNASSRGRWRDLNYAAEIFYRFKLADAAGAFAKESINFAEKNNDKWMTRTSHRNLAMIYGDLQKFPDAYNQVDLALEISRNFPDGSLRKRLVSDSTQVLADLQRQAGDCPKAIENYDLALQSYGDMEFNIFKYDAGKGQLLCNIAQKNNSAVKDDIPGLLKSFDEDRRKITDESDRNIFFDSEQSVYDVAIDYTFSELNDKEQSFNYAENSRARSLLSLIRNNSELTQPLKLNEIQQQLPVNGQVLYYVVLPDKILIWYLSHSKFIVFEKLIKQDELNKKVLDYTKLLTSQTDDQQLHMLAEDLYGVLIEPVAALLEKDKPLCIIADKVLFRLPFAALVSPRTDKYLIEDYLLFSAPSATVLVTVTELAGQRTTGQNETVLSIGNPSFSHVDYPDLANLPDASREAKKIAVFYNTPQVFTENEAVKDRLVAALNSSDVIHFAGHYAPNSKASSLSKLVLAAGDLSVEEIMKMKLSRPRLLILSACETGVERFYNGEGMIGVARAFLASNIPLIVASQWSVDSEATAELMIKFHNYRKLQQLTTIAALRQAQIDMLSDENSRFHQPFYWAGFLSIGGFANY